MGRIDGRWRDLVVAIAAVGGVLFVLWLYTGNWPPPVVVESNSMMHVEPGEYLGNYGDTRAAGVPYGRFGTIDPGDLVLVKDIGSWEDVDTFALDRDDHYGLAGDVLVYYPWGDRARTPIIHRAVTYIEVSGEQDARRYVVQWSDAWTQPPGARCAREPVHQCMFGLDGVTIPELRVQARRFQHSGFITKGDNAAGNVDPDQVNGLVSEPVKMEWVQGVARGELPWFGVIKLMMTGAPKNVEMQDHPYYSTLGRMTAPRDVWVMLVVGIAFVALAPVGAEVGWKRIKAARAKPEEPATAASPEAVAAPGDDRE